MTTLKSSQGHRRGLRPHARALLAKIAAVQEVLKSIRSLPKPLGTG